MRIEPSRLRNGSIHRVKEKTKALVWGCHKSKESSECTIFVFHALLQVRIIYTSMLAFKEVWISCLICGHYKFQFLFLWWCYEFEMTLSISMAM